MPLQKLSKAELTGAKRGAGARPEYVAMMRGMQPGSGGRVYGEKASRQTIKTRLKKAAAAAGIEIKFRRSTAADEVLFEVVG